MKFLTFAGTPVTTSSEAKEVGVIHGKGVSIIMAESEIATLTGEVIGRISSSGATKWRTSKGKLAFLNNMVAVFEGEFDAEGNFYSQVLGMEVSTYSCRPFFLFIFYPLPSSSWTFN
jgi:hypothetical protein